MVRDRFYLRGDNKAEHRKMINECVALAICIPLPFGCGQKATEFSDELSVKTYHFSGLCQTCQDILFGGN